ncbi:hypothetical protein OAI81_00545 [Candidatus Pelagibacter sp.]|nr:hypothetical protein [Candidatus Pelagibacter sp.]
MCVGSTVGPNIFIKICAWSTAQISRELMLQIKKEFGGNISKTAKFVGMERSALHRKLKILGIKGLN